MRYIGIIKLLVLCLTLLFFTGCMINTVKPETVIGNLENQEDINQNSNNPQSSSTGPVEEPVIEDTEEPGTVYPQKWATGDGTAENPWANDCIQKAYDFVPDGGTIFLKAGSYQLAGALTISKAINIIGEGMGRTIVRTSTTFGFKVRNDYCTIKGMTIDGDAQPDGEDFMCINIQDCDYIILEDIEAKNSYTGIQPFRVNHSLFKNIYTHHNEHEGIHPISDTAGRGIYNTFQNIYAWENASSGFDGGRAGTNPSFNTYDNLHCWDNGRHGIAINYEIGIVLSNSSASGNGVNGIYLRNLEDSTINNCLVTLNVADGMLLSTDVKNVNFTNVIVKNNKTGINIYNSSGLVFTSCQSYDDRDTPLQAYGIELTGANTNISLVNCKLTPNKEGEIYNPAGVAVKIITEKMFAEFLAL